LTYFRFNGLGSDGTGSVPVYRVNRLAYPTVNVLIPVRHIPKLVFKSTIYIYRTVLALKIIHVFMLVPR
jgi:hypothetical protein